MDVVDYTNLKHATKAELEEAIKDSFGGIVDPACIEFMRELGNDCFHPVVNVSPQKHDTKVTFMNWGSVLVNPDTGKVIGDLPWDLDKKPWWKVW